MSEPEYLQEYIRIQKPKNWDDFTPQIKQKIKETILENEQKIHEDCSAMIVNVSQMQQWNM